MHHTIASTCGCSATSSNAQGAASWSFSCATCSNQHPPSTNHRSRCGADMCCWGLQVYWASLQRLCGKSWCELEGKKHHLRYRPQAALAQHGRFFEGHAYTAILHIK